MASSKFVIYNLRETYHELGDYGFKVVLDPKFFRNGHNSRVACVDSDGRTIPVDVKTWGRKVNCTFSIVPTVSDGVAVLTFDLEDDDGHRTQGRASFWVVK